MIERVLAFSVRRRWYVLLFTIAAAVSGAWALTVLPIDAVPDVTNVQVQVNAFAPALSPLEVEKQVTFRVLEPDERLDTVTTSASEVIRPTVYGQLIIGLVYVPLLTFSGVEGKTFQPMALTVLIALTTAFVLSLTFMPAMIAIVVTGKVNESENSFVRGLKALYRPALAAVIRRPLPSIVTGIVLFAGAALLFTRLGQEFLPTL